MNDYFEGSVKQHLERGKRLLVRIPTNLPRELHLLAQTCQKELDHILNELEALLYDPMMQLPKYQPERLRRFRRIVAALSLFETIGIAALERFNEKDDIFLNKLIERICHEISYPLLPPVVTSLSQEYFHIYHHLNLLFVPLSEGDFLLHLPDLYHELAHPLLIKNYNPRVKFFQDALFDAFSIVMQYLSEEQNKEGRRRGPEEYSLYLIQWKKSWGIWLIEFFCDLFATYTAGPTFAWSHFHLCAKRGDNPFYVPTVSTSSHPADDARMRAILFGLGKMGFAQEIEAIQKHWDELLSVSGARPEPEYHRCYPDHILKGAAEKAYEGVSAMDCRVARPETNDPVYNLLNQAWVEFWKKPVEYASWEYSARNQLRGLCGLEE